MINGRRRWKFSRRSNLSVDPYSVGDCFLWVGQAVGIAGIDSAHYLAIVPAVFSQQSSRSRSAAGESGRARLLSGLNSCRSSLKGLLRCRPRSGYWQCCPRVSLLCLASPTSFRSQSTILLKHRRSRPNLEANSLLAELSLYSLNSSPAVG